MSSRTAIALSAAIIATAWVSPLRAQQAGGLFPAPSRPDAIARQPALEMSGAGGAFQRQPVPAFGNSNAPQSAPMHDGWGGVATRSIERAPLDVLPPELAPDGPGRAAAAALNRHLDQVQDLLTDQEDVRPAMVEQGENLEWEHINQAMEDGDFADPNSAEKQIGWVARTRNGKAPKLRQPRVDLKGMTRLKLNENGSTVLDLTKGRVITRF